MSKTVLFYKTRSNSEPCLDWLYSLKDFTTIQRIQARFRRLETGNYGDYKRFDGLLEIRFHFGKGYRLYCCEDGDNLVVLLMGGDKDTQFKDIDKALRYMEDYYGQKEV